MNLSLLLLNSALMLTEEKTWLDLIYFSLELIYYKQPKHKQY